MTNKIDELKQMEAFKELLEVKITGLKEEIEEQEEQEEQENKKFPQNGDDYFFIISIGLISEDVYDGNITDLQRLVIGNMFKTKEEANYMRERLKVLKELKEFSTKFERNDENYYLVFWEDDDFVGVMSDDNMRLDSIYFESREKAREAIKAVGEERLKKYYFGIEE